jgi:hypothetical protein
MNACDEFINRVNRYLPEVCRVTDLVNVGIFTCPQSARKARTLNQFPEYFRIGKRIMIPKRGVIEWLEGCKRGKGYEDRSETATFGQGSTIADSDGQDGVA